MVEAAPKRKGAPTPVRQRRKVAQVPNDIFAAKAAAVQLRKVRRRKSKRSASPERMARNREAEAQHTAAISKMPGPDFKF